MNKLAPHHDRTFCALKAKHFLRFASSLFLPLMLGIFTVIITFRQQTEADRQRLEDRQLSREQREQDLNLSRDQREQDQEQARLLREQDLNISRLQRELDKQIAEERRQFDLKLSQQKETRELFIAEKQRNMSEQQLLHEHNVEITRRREELFTAYIDEVGALLDQYNGTPTAHPVTAALIRVSTLTAIRQLDPVRNSYLIHFLYIAGQLTNGEHPPPIDLSDALLDNIDLSRGAHDKPMHGLSLAGAYLRNASFAKRDLSGANFQRATLTEAQFNSTNMTNANFSAANLFRANFYAAVLFHTDFARANLSNAYLQYSKLRHVQFTSETILDHADLSSASAPNVSFVNMTRLLFTSFIQCDCVDAHFDSAILTGSDFSYAILKRATFTRTTLNRARLLAANTEKADFTQASMSMTNCTLMKSAGASFYRVEGQNAVFLKADLSYVNFSNAISNFGDFSQAIISYSTLTNCQFTRTNWTKTNLFAANLSLSDLTDAHGLTDEQFFSATSIRSTLLPNGTVGRDDPSLIYNGSAICNTTMINTFNPLNPLYLSNGWIYSAGDLIITRPLNNNTHDCVFAPGTNVTRPILARHFIRLSKYRHHIAVKRLVLNLSARFGNTTVISLEWEDFNTIDIRQHILSKNILVP